MKGFGGMGQMGQMMKQAQLMQMNIQKAQKELETIEVTGEAGNGMVKVTMIWSAQTAMWKHFRTCCLSLSMMPISRLKQKPTRRSARQPAA